MSDNQQRSESSEYELDVEDQAAPVESTATAEATLGGQGAATPIDFDLEAVFARYRSDVGWIFLVAALTLVNVGMVHMGAEISFVIGMGITQLIDTIAADVASGLESGGALVRGIAIMLDVLVIGALVAMGWFSRNGHAWALILCIIAYALDTLLCVGFAMLGGGWMLVMLHLVAMFFMCRAMASHGKLKRVGAFNA